MFSLQAYVILLLAAVLEAGGDALVRHGLASSGLTRGALFALGAAVLFAYGLTVNAPAWDFGKLLGVYVTLFFLVAQVMNVVLFHAKPDASVIAGGTLIVAGGLLMTFWR